MRNVDIILTVPTYNEHKNIENFYLKFKKYIKNYKYFIIFIDDSDNNLTKKEINKFFNKKKIIIIKSKKFYYASSRGYASWTGIKFALKNFNFKFISDVDVDLPEMLIDLAKINSLIKKNNYLIYSKYHQNAKIINRSLFRIFLSRCVNVFCSFLYTNKIDDYTSLRVYDYKCAKYLLKNFKFKFNSPMHNLDILIFLYKTKKFLFTHIPFIYIERNHHSSTVNFFTLITCLRDFFIILRNFKKNTYSNTLNL